MSLLVVLDDPPDAWQCWTAARFAATSPGVRFACIRAGRSARQGSATRLSVWLGERFIGRRERRRHQRVLDRLLEGAFWRTRWEQELSPTQLRAESANDLKAKLRSSQPDIVVLLSVQAPISDMPFRGRLLTFCVSRMSLPWGSLQGSRILASAPEVSGWRVVRDIQPQWAPGDTGDVLALKTLVESTVALLEVVDLCATAGRPWELGSAPSFQDCTAVAGLRDWFRYLLTARGRYARLLCERGCEE